MSSQRCDFSGKRPSPRSSRSERRAALCCLGWHLAIFRSREAPTGAGSSRGSILEDVHKVHVTCFITTSSWIRLTKDNFKKIESFFLFFFLLNLFYWLSFASLKSKLHNKTWKISPWPFSGPLIYCNATGYHYDPITFTISFFLDVCQTLIYLVKTFFRNPILLKTLPNIPTKSGLIIIFCLLFCYIYITYILAIHIITLQYSIIF